MSTNDINTEEIGKAYIIRLPINVDQTLKSKIESLVPHWLLSQSQVYVLDLTNVLIIQAQTYPVFTQLAHVLKKNNKKLFSFGANEKIVRQFSADGVNQVFNPSKNINDIYLKAGLKSPASQSLALDSNFINPFINATIDILKIQTNIEIKPGKPFAQKSAQKESDIAIAAVISLMSSAFKGTVSLEFPLKTFLAIYEAMLGEKYTTINDEIKDGAGEILNMIYGQAKTMLNEKGYQLERAIPTILVGEKLQVRHDTAGISLVVPLESSVGVFQLQVSLSNN